MVGGMSDYLVWAAERLEKKYGWKFEDAQEYMVSGNHIPYDISLDKYVTLLEKEEK